MPHVNPLEGAASLMIRSFFPHFCVGCGAEGRTVCAVCRPGFENEAASARPAPKADGPLAAVCGAMPYEFRWAGRLLRLYKYDRVDEAGREVAALFATHVRANLFEYKTWADDAFVLPMPMHPFRHALRGCNQAEIFARAFARETGARYVPNLLAKRFRLKRQAELESKAERQKNARGSIAVQRRFPAGAKFVLIDDVFTTGSTLRACADALKRAGAGEVRALTFLQVE